MPADQNIVGKTVRKLRYERGWTQEVLAAKCGVAGFDISRATLSKIEAQLRCVTDKELLVLARALNVSVEDLFGGRLSL